MDEEIKQIPKLRTFEADIEKFGSIKPPQKENGPIPVRRIIFIAVISFVAVFGIYKFINFITKSSTEEKNPSPAQTQIGQPFTKADTESKLNFVKLDPGSLVRAIIAEKNAGRKIGAIAFLPVELTLREFSDFIQMGIPESILENAFPEFNIFAVYGQQSSDLAFIIKTKNFSKAYSSMLSWEKTMWASFKPFLNSEDVNNISQFSFADEIVRNHDARVLKNTDNKSILTYAIFNKQFVVIATSREALSTILQRLITSPPNP